MVQLNEQREQLSRAIKLLSDMIVGSPLAQFDARIVAYALIMYATNHLSKIVFPANLAKWLDVVATDVRERHALPGTIIGRIAHQRAFSKASNQQA